MYMLCTGQNFSKSKNAPRRRSRQSKLENVFAGKNTLGEKTHLGKTIFTRVGKRGN